MTGTSVELAGVVVRSPVSVATNLVLAVECGGLAWLLSRHAPSHPEAEKTSRWRGLWAGFFFFTALSAAAGALKHGLPPDAPEAVLGAVRFCCSAATGAAAFAAVLATIEVRCRPARLGSLLRGAAALHLLVFLTLTARDPRFHLVVAQTAAGLLPVTAVEFAAHRRGSAAAGWLFAGLSLSALTAGVYLLRLSPGPWFNHVDLAHVLVMAGVLLVYRGCALEPLPTAPAAEASCRPV